MLFNELKGSQIRARVMKATNITFGEKILLIYLVDHCDDEYTVIESNSEICENIGIAEPASISKMMKHLVSAGYVSLTHFVQPGTTTIRRSVQLEYNFIYKEELKSQAEQAKKVEPVKYDSDLPFNM